MPFIPTSFHFPGKTKMKNEPKATPITIPNTARDITNMHFVNIFIRYYFPLIFVVSAVWLSPLAETEFILCYINEVMVGTIPFFC